MTLEFAQQIALDKLVELLTMATDPKEIRRIATTILSFKRRPPADTAPPVQSGAAAKPSSNVARPTSIQPQSTELPTYTPSQPIATTASTPRSRPPLPCDMNARRPPQSARDRGKS